MLGLHSIAGAAIAGVPSSAFWQSGVSRLERSYPVKRTYPRRIWHIDLPVPENVKEVIETAAEEIIASPANFESKSDRIELLEQELLAEGLKYQKKYIEYLQEAIASIRQQMLAHAETMMAEQQRKLRRRKIAMLLLE